MLARCASAVARGEIGVLRAQYRESVALFRGCGRGREADAGRVLQWWAGAEAAHGNLGEAARITEEAMPLVSGELVLWTTSAGASIYWALGSRQRAEALTRRALELAAKVAHPILLPSAVSYVALMASERDPLEAVRLLAFADDRRQKSGHKRSPDDDAMFAELDRAVHRVLSEDEVRSARLEGSGWSDQQAYARAARV